VLGLGRPAADELKAKMKAVKDAITAKDFKKVGEVLDEVEKLVATDTQ
jgi:hypothetical protein